MTTKRIPTNFDRVSALYRKCRAYMLTELMKQGGTATIKQRAEHLILTKNTMHAFADCVAKGNAESMFRDMDIPKYMFAERPVTPSTWLELTSAQLDTYMLSDGTALLVDPVTRQYCYVFWDEAEQCSNPYPSHAEAVMARTVYIANM